MRTTEGKALFNDAFLHQYLARRSAVVRPQVEQLPLEDFSTCADHELAARVLADVRVEPLVLDRESTSLSFHDVTLDAREDPNRAAFHFNRGHPVPLPATRHVFSIPFAGTSDLWRLCPSSFGSTQPRGIVSGQDRSGHLTLVFTEPKDSKVDIQQLLADELSLIDSRRDAQRSEIEAFNEGLRQAIVSAVAARRVELAEREEFAKTMGVTIMPDTRAARRGASARPVRPAAHPGPKKWDIFVSYAGEDRDSVARPLAHALQARKISVWFDKFELSLGDRLRRKIDEGLSHSRYGVVILSEAFFRKHWPQAELDGLIARESSGGDVILPIWHGLSEAQVAAYSPTLASRVAASSADGIEAVVEAIVGKMAHP